MLAGTLQATRSAKLGGTYPKKQGFPMRFILVLIAIAAFGFAQAAEKAEKCEGGCPIEKADAKSSSGQFLGQISGDG